MRENPRKHSGSWSAVLDGLLERGVGKRAGVQVVEVDVIQPEAAHAHVGGLAEVQTLAGMKADGLIRHIGLSNVTAEQLRTAMSMTDIATVTVHYNVAVRLGAAVREIAEDAGIVFSPWHPGAVPAS